MDNIYQAEVDVFIGRNKTYATEGVVHFYAQSGVMNKINIFQQFVRMLRIMNIIQSYYRESEYLIFLCVLLLFIDYFCF